MAEQLGSAGSGPVVLDIGGAIGAAIVYTDATAAGSEMEIRRAGSPWAGQHTAVRHRHAPGGSVTAAVFESLEEGSYQVRFRGGLVAAGSYGEFVVAGGRVTYARLEEMVAS